MNRKHLLAASIAAALSGPSLAAGFGDTSLNLYFKLPFGGSPSQTRESYGFAVQQRIAVDGPLSPRRLTRSLVDFRFQDRQLQNLKLNGVTLLARDRRSNELTLGGTEISTGTAVAIGALVVVGGLCITENIICEDSNPVPPPPPSEGG